MNIGEIANRAGVSRSAVSRYFNQGSISPEKKEAIRRVVEETGFRPSMQAKTLRTKKSNLIGVVLPRIESASVGRMTAGILSVLDEYGYRLLLTDSRCREEAESEYLTLLNASQVDGVIFLATVLSKQVSEALHALDVPVVILGQECEKYPCVVQDDYRASFALTSLMIARGSRNPGFLGVFMEDLAVGEARYRGFADALAANGLGDKTGQMEVSDFSILAGKASAQILMGKYPDLDAMICATDDIAVGAMQYLKEKGISIPEDFKLAGFGNAIISQVVTPPLTTVDYDYIRSGAEAAKLLLGSILSQEETGQKRIQMPFRILERTSTSDISLTVDPE